MEPGALADRLPDRVLQPVRGYAEPYDRVASGELLRRCTAPGEHHGGEGNRCCRPLCRRGVQPGRRVCEVLRRGLRERHGQHRRADAGPRGPHHRHRRTRRAPLRGNDGCPGPVLRPRSLWRGHAHRLDRRGEPANPGGHEHPPDDNDHGLRRRGDATERGCRREPRTRLVNHLERAPPCVHRQRPRVPGHGRERTVRCGAGPDPPGS